MSASDPAENTASLHLEPLVLDSHHSTTPVLSNRLHGKQEIRDTLRPLVARGSDSRGDYMSAPVDDNQPDELHAMAKETGIIIRKAEVVPPALTVGSKSHKRKMKDYRGHVWYAWRWELLQFLLTTGLYTAICLILDRYSDKALPDWDNLGITLNTLISVIATFFRATIAVIAFEILAQLYRELE
ncbi:uncharacterized protein FRV6_01019 [Fusarium oxysporum]|uniref:Uncharacterized protein n=1 Tax=Fusarium oxysporum TaxID=5507 RepID=A0A2H3SJY1_FUSOX|nr:uncharacterized protein FRV6_01019 [Fusarium oxysporum]